MGDGKPSEQEHHPRVTKVTLPPDYQQRIVLYTEVPSHNKRTLRYLRPLQNTASHLWRKTGHKHLQRLNHPPFRVSRVNTRQPPQAQFSLLEVRRRQGVKHYWQKKAKRHKAAQQFRFLTSEQKSQRLPGTQKQRVLYLLSLPSSSVTVLFLMMKRQTENIYLFERI